jgi:hypothetical protein
MSEYEIFTNIQFAVLNMNIEDKIRLLNDCLTALNNIQKNQPDFKGTITTFLDKNSCVLDSNSRRLLKYGLETFGIVGDEFLIENLQSAGKKRTGGARGDERGLVHSNGEIVEGKQTTITSTQQSVANFANFVLSLEGLDITQRTKLMADYLEILKIQEQTNLARANADLPTANADLARANASAVTSQALAEIELDNQRFIKNLIRGSLTFSFTAPAALVYYLKSTLDIVGVGTINFVGKGVANVVGVAELGVRNVVPAFLNAAISLGRTTMPESVSSFFQGVGSSLIGETWTEYASESYLGEQTRQLTSVGADAGGGTIMVGCIIFYLALVLLLSILTSLIIKLQTDKTLKMYIGIPGIYGISLGHGGKKTRKNRKNRRKRNHKKSHHKKKYKK